MGSELKERVGKYLIAYEKQINAGDKPLKITAHTHKLIKDQQARIEELEADNERYERKKDDEAIVRHCIWRDMTKLHGECTEYRIAAQERERTLQTRIDELETENKALDVNNDRLIGLHMEAVADNEKLRAMQEEDTHQLKRVMEERDRLEAKEVWQDIGSAPKDGSRILLYDSDRMPFIGHWSVWVRVGEWQDTQLYKDRWETDGEGFEAFPTHWMPLPEVIVSPKHCKG